MEVFFVDTFEVKMFVNSMIHQIPELTNQKNTSHSQTNKCQLASMASNFSDRHF